MNYGLFNEVKFFAVFKQQSEPYVTTLTLRIIKWGLGLNFNPKSKSTKTTSASYEKLASSEWDLIQQLNFVSTEY
jgi:hypothetical protein